MSTVGPARAPRIRIDLSVPPSVLRQSATIFRLELHHDKAARP